MSTEYAERLPEAMRPMADNIEAWARALPDLLSAGHAGKVVLLRHGQVVEVCDDLAQGLAKARELYGDDRQFLIQKIEQDELDQLRMLDMMPDPAPAESDRAVQ